MQDTIDTLANALRDAAPAFFEAGPPDAHIVLGSGLSALVDRVTDSTIVPFDDLAGMPGVGVQGHKGAFQVGALGGRRVLVQAGRLHLYEGHAPADVVLPIRIGAAVGSKVLILTNAAGGIRRDLAPGAAMVIDDHINLMWRSPLAGPVVGEEGRSPDMSQPYDHALQQLAERVGLEQGVRLERGVYAAVLGPSFETPSEIRMLARLGADAVGMSTAPEAIVGAALGLRVLGFSMISNHAAGLGPPLSHDEVMEVGKTAGSVLGRVIEGVLEALPSS